MISGREIKEASDRLQGLVHHTPLFRSHYLDQLFKGQVYLKAENLQKTGSFKARGALNAILSLDEQALKSGVATHSSGNHGQALAWAARRMDVPAFIVMPENAPSVKVAAVRHYGAQIQFCASNLPAREAGLEKVMADTGASFIPPYNFHHTIAGQATCAYEILQDMAQPDILLVPVGGGGLLSGSALSARAFSPGTRTVGCEPEQANDAWRSFKEGHFVPSVNPDTIADGLRTSLGDITYGYIKEFVDDILTCSETGIVRAMRLIWERMKLVVEPSAAVPLACMMENPEYFRGQRVAMILSGGNVDLDRLPFQKA